jgi:transposase
MPQLQLPIFPAGSTSITDSIAVECRSKQVVYVYGTLPIFQHAEGDRQSFRLITSQRIDSGAARQVDIVKAFGVPLVTVKRYLKLLREHGSKAFFAAPKRRAAPVLTEEVRSVVAALLQEGRSVPEVAKTTGIHANTLHKAIRAGRLPAAEKKSLIAGNSVATPRPPRASGAKQTAAP